MIFQSLYFLTDEAIVYQQLYKQGTVIQFADFNMIAEQRSGLFTSKALDTLLQDSQSSLQALYHLAAVHQKYIPTRWDWESLMYIKEQQQYEKIAGEIAYLKAKGRLTRPEFFNDYDAWDYEARIIKWAQEQGLYKTSEVLLDQTRRNIQTLIYDLSKTDFIQLTDEQINLIHGIVS